MLLFIPGVLIKTLGIFLFKNNNLKFVYNIQKTASSETVFILCAQQARLRQKASAGKILTSGFLWLVIIVALVLIIIILALLTCCKCRFEFAKTHNIKQPHSRLLLYCAPSRIRTCDHLLKRQLLYQLSYGRYYA